MTDLPQRLGMIVHAGPERVGSELRWNVEHEGQPALLGQLLPELAHDASVRRRYVRDVERLQALSDTALAQVLALGPTPDPCDPEAAPPWRIRFDPPGETLEAWLDRRAPLPIDEAAQIVAQLAERLHGLHAHGAVLRDLNPQHVVRGDDGQLWLTDVGLARVDILSTRTAASLLLEGSPYAAPELLARTLVDQRADLYGLGVILFRALTGMLPHADTHSLLRPPGPAPRVRALRPQVSEALDDLVARCMDEDPSRRPGSAAELSEALVGLRPLPAQQKRVPCQSCGHSLRPGQRLCTQCGKLAVQFTKAQGDESYDVELRKIDEKIESRTTLEQILGAVSSGPLPAMNFLVGDARMYSKEERAMFEKLPAKLVSGLSQSSAEALDARMREAGLQTRVVNSADLSVPTGQKIAMVVGTVAAVAIGLAIAVAIGEGALIGIPVLLVACGVIMAILHRARRRRLKKLREAPPLVQLRPAPAALPASDPLVARLGTLLQSNPSADLREQVGELALAVQRLVDHRARTRSEAEEIDAVTAPVEELVRLVEAQVHAIGAIDDELKKLDEGALVRELAAVEARGNEPAARETVLEGLDRLRTLEDTRSRRFHRLLEAARLARRAVELGLAVRDPQVEHERQVALALASLDHELGTE